MLLALGSWVLAIGCVGSDVTGGYLKVGSSCGEVGFGTVLVGTFFGVDVMGIFFVCVWRECDVGRVALRLCGKASDGSSFLPSFRDGRGIGMGDIQI